MSEKKNLTLEDMIARKETPLQQTAEVYVPCLDGNLTIQRQSLVTYQRAVDAINGAESAEERLRATFEAVYAFCPILHEPALQEAYGCKVPPDIVPLVFREDAGSIGAVFSAILALYGDGVRDELKN